MLRRLQYFLKEPESISEITTFDASGLYNSKKSAVTKLEVGKTFSFVLDAVDRWLQQRSICGASGVPVDNIKRPLAPSKVNPYGIVGTVTCMYCSLRSTSILSGSFFCILQALTKRCGCDRVLVFDSRVVSLLELVH